MKITLICKAETEEDFLRKVLGRRAELLNDSGRRSAVRLKNMKLNSLNFDYCFISPLISCFETAMILVGDRVEIIRDERIIQREMGELDGRPLDEYNAFKFWDYKLNQSLYGVESVHDLIDRCSDFLCFLKEKYKDKNILIITHNEPYRALRHLIRGERIEGNLLDGKIDCLSIEEFEI